MDSIASMRYTRQLFKSTNCEIYLGESLDESIRERSHGQPVVIKQFLKTLSGTGQKSFLQELSLMYLFVENDLFVRLYGYHERPHLMVMKHYEGGSLKQFLFQERPADFVFSMEIKFKFMLQISRAISEMHQLGLAHVDLKLQNVFVDIKRGLNGADYEYSCVLGDFGLASILDKSILLVQAYRVHNRRGFSAGYAAPEVIKRVKAGNFFIAQIPAVIKAGDLYAFGIMGYEILQEKIAWRL
jgi:serine/threonine protein kinase